MPMLAVKMLSATTLTMDAHLAGTPACTPWGKPMATGTRWDHGEVSPASSGDQVTQGSGWGSPMLVLWQTAPVDTSPRRLRSLYNQDQTFFSARYMRGGRGGLARGNKLLHCSIRCCTLTGVLPTTTFFGDQCYAGPDDLLRPNNLCNSC